MPALKDEPDVAAAIRAAGERAIERLLGVGLDHYGPLDVTSRDWIEEALDEVADAQVYLAALAVRLERVRRALKEG